MYCVALRAKTQQHFRKKQHPTLSQNDISETFSQDTFQKIQHSIKKQILQNT